MSQKLPNMLESTIQKIREMLDVNTVVGTPITTPDPDSPVPSLQGPCDRSLKSEVPCGSCLNWR